MMPPADDQLSRMAAARDDWLSTAVEAVCRHPWVGGAWLVGSLGRRDADPFSDVDLVVATRVSTPAAVFTDPIAGLGLPGPVLYTRTKPRNAPARGSYLTVCVELAGLSLLVDLYLWPDTTAAVPTGARILYDDGGVRRSALGFIALLDDHRSTDTTGADPHDAANVLMLVQLAAKYLARGDGPNLAAITARLGGPADASGLRRLLTERMNASDRPDLRPAVTAACRLLALVEQARITRDPSAPVSGGRA